MKIQKTSLFVALIVIVVSLVFMIQKNSSSQEIQKSSRNNHQKSEGPNLAPSRKATATRDALGEARPAPKEMPSITNAVTTDRAQTLKLIDAISRHPLEKERHLQENQWIKRRQIVEMDESFHQIGQRILAGEKITEITLPLFDDESITLDITGKDSQRFFDDGESGIFKGKFAGDSLSTIVVAYAGEEQSGLIHIPSKNIRILYDTFGHRRVIVKDYDERAHANATPCAHCRHEGTVANHAAHAE